MNIMQQIESREYYLERFKHFRYDMTDEIPNRIIHSNEDQPMRFKVRKNWFQGVIADSANCIYDGYTNSQTAEMFKQFHMHVSQNMLDRNTRRDDIDIGNQFLDVIIADLQK